MVSIFTGAQAVMQGLIRVRAIVAVVTLLQCVTHATVMQAQRRATPSNPGASVPNTRPNFGKFPAGWTMRHDSTTARSAGDSTTLTVGNFGWDVQSGPSVLVTPPRHNATGSFIIAALLYVGQAKTHAMPGYGVFFGGKNMGTPNARYIEFLVRADGQYCVRQHVGNKLTVLKDWTVVAGINAHDGHYDTVAGNRFRIIADERLVQIVVNRVVAYSMLREAASPDGVFGVRVGADQDVTVSSVEIEKVGADQGVPPLTLPPRSQPKGRGVPAGQRQG